MSEEEIRARLNGCEWTDAAAMQAMCLDAVMSFAARLEVYYHDDGKTLMLVDPESDAILKRFSADALKAEYDSIMSGADNDLSAREGLK